MTIYAKCASAICAVISDITSNNSTGNICDLQFEDTFGHIVLSKKLINKIAAVSYRV